MVPNLKGGGMKGAKVLSSEEIQGMLQTTNQRNRMGIWTGRVFGTRISETVQLTFGDFKGQAVHIRSVKRSNDRHLIIPDEFRKDLERLKANYIAKGCPVLDSTPLFLSNKRDPEGNCKPISKQHACLIIKRLRDEHGLDERVSAHSFRKCFTTKIFKLTKNNLVQTAVYTGHKSLNSLHAYIKTTQETNLTRQLGWI